MNFCMHPSVRPAVTLRDEDVRQLLSTALRLRHGKAQSSLPEQLMAVFIQVGVGWKGGGVKARHTCPIGMARHQKADSWLP